MDYTPRCNFLQCRAQIIERAVVTTCSHIFCVRCADSLNLSSVINDSRICPACESQLNGIEDVIMTQLEPSESYKTSILSGLSPAIIMECAARGLAFYTYQAAQEMLEEYLSKGLAEKHVDMNLRTKQFVDDANSEISHLKVKLSTFEKEYSALSMKNKELIEAYNERARSHIKCQSAYDHLEKCFLQSNVADTPGHIRRSVGTGTQRGATENKHLMGGYHVQEKSQGQRRLRTTYTHVREGSSSSNECSMKAIAQKFDPKHYDDCGGQNNAMLSSHSKTYLPINNAQPLSTSNVPRYQRCLDQSGGSARTSTHPTARQSLSALPVKVSNYSSKCWSNGIGTKKPALVTAEQSKAKLPLNDYLFESAIRHN